MSYSAPKRSDSINEFFSRQTDFLQLAPNLLKAEDERVFEIWLEKLELIDRRSLYLFLKKHKDEIPPEHLKIAQWRFRRDL